MSEEEIIKGINKVLEIEKNTIHHCSDGLYDFHRIIQGLLDLYNKEKEKNKELEKYRGLYENEMLGYIAGYEDGKHHRLTATVIVAEENKQKRLEQMIKQKYISKDKIREILEKYEKCEIEYGIYFYKEIQELLEEK